MRKNTSGRFTLIATDSKWPRVAPSIVRRRGLEGWLRRFKDVPVRFLIAPPGFGKTTVLLSYLHHSATGGLYCELRAGATPADIWDSISKLLASELTARSHEELCGALASHAPLELALDCQELPNADGIEEILRLISDAPAGVALLIASRSRTDFRVTQMVCDGAAVLCDAERLAFDVAEVRQIAETCGVSFENADVARLLELTDGWPQVVSSALRKAAEDECPLAKAFDNWRLRRHHIFEDFVSHALPNPLTPEADLVRRLLNGVRVDDLAQLQALEEHGLFVIHTDSGYRALRPLARGRTCIPRERHSKVVPAMQVRCFGWFTAEVDGQTIEWVRRRDRQVFAYLCLQRNGHATRDEVARAFWPEGDKQLVAQSLRTVCSNIRKAIALCVGSDSVDEYFRSVDDLSINTTSVIVDVTRFLTHAEDGDDQYVRGVLKSAYDHYCLAASAYQADLLIADAQEPWVSTLDVTLRARQTLVSQRIAEITGP